MSQFSGRGEHGRRHDSPEDTMLITIIVIALAVIGLLALFGLLRGRA
jgi:hypothetical protein